MFKTIYVDPPWSYKTWDKVDVPRRAKVARGMATMYYPVMSLEEMQEINVKSISDKDCVLLMWATWPRLDSALELGKSWGFTYKTNAFLWAKTTPKRGDSMLTAKDGWHFGLGYWTRANTEPCLLFTRGKPKRINNDVAQFLVAPVGKHSAKPHETYERIERLLPGPYCEMFARNTREGWTSLGNEIDGLDIREAVNKLYESKQEAS